MTKPSKKLKLELRVGDAADIQRSLADLSAIMSLLGVSGAKVNRISNLSNLIQNEIYKAKHP
jgi:hypothetical protein